MSTFGNLNALGTARNGNTYALAYGLNSVVDDGSSIYTMNLPAALVNARVTVVIQCLSTTAHPRFVVSDGSGLIPYGNTLNNTLLNTGGASSSVVEFISDGTSWFEVGAIISLVN